MIDNRHPLSRLYVSGFAGGGIAIGDVDGDGLADVYLARGPLDNRLFRQTSNLHFDDATQQAGVAAAGRWSTGAALADVDNDGDLDLYVCTYDTPNLLYINDGHGRFHERGASSGVAVRDASQMAYFCDYDRDGDLDFYLLANRLYRQGGLPTGQVTRLVGGKPALRPEFQRYYEMRQVAPHQYRVRTAGRSDHLFENDGTGHFRDVTKAAGIRGADKGLSVVWYDYDLDGLPDIYVANDFIDPDRLYRNNGNGTFTDVIQQVVPYTTWSSMGSDSADVNNDGLMDLMVLDMAGTTHYKEQIAMSSTAGRERFMDYSEPRQLMRSVLFLNSGVGRFLECARLSGLAKADWSWAVKLADYDNDGLTDVFIANGMTADMTNADLGLRQTMLVGREEWQLFRNHPRKKDANLAFRNQGHLRFQDVSRVWGLDHRGMSYSAAWGDLDRDGDLDLVVNNLDARVQVYRNSSQNGHRVTFSLRGRVSNSFGLGAVVRIECGAQKQMRVLNPMTGFASSNEPIAHFGLGPCETIDRLSIEWPSGCRQQFTAVAADRHYLITEPDGIRTASTRSSPAAKPPMFAALALPDDARHTEQPFDDYAMQPLLPNKLSQLGPGVAIADIDSDGDEDFCFSAARGQKPRLYLRETGTFVPAGLAGDRRDTMCEDFAPLLLDADRDGDLDLYVVSGGVEFGNDVDLLSDRLYLNDGAGHFEAAPAGALPKLHDSGSVAAAADFDRDGDLDLFVGTRVIPGQYPLSGSSRLLRNDCDVAGEARFADVTSTLAPALTKAGMVTSALWSDANGDGWIDLLVTVEWGPVRLLLNDHGRLVQRTQQAGLAAYTGWYNGIAGRDLDGDGDIDYVATNFGRNTKYHPTAARPARIYYGKFGSQDRPRIVEAEVAEGGLLPVRGKSCIQKAMPALRKKFPKYHDYASATLTDIYSKTALAGAQLFEANTLDSVVLINDGTGRFSVRPLPELAQISPGFGVVATEVDGDGNADIYLVQNFFHPQRVTGKMAGGLSVLLRGDGNGGFDQVWPNRSGLVVPGDAKGLSVCDLNDDGWVDFVVGVNNRRVLARENRIGSFSDNRVAKVRLVGRAGNPTAVGARVCLERTDGQRQTDEVRAGGSYLSQSTADLFFGLGDSSRIRRVLVRWPDGQRSEHIPSAGDHTVVIRQP